VGEMQVKELPVTRPIGGEMPAIPVPVSWEFRPAVDPFQNIGDVGREGFLEIPAAQIRCDEPPPYPPPMRPQEQMGKDLLIKAPVTGRRKQKLPVRNPLERRQHAGSRSQHGEMTGDNVFMRSDQV